MINSQSYVNILLIEFGLAKNISFVKAGEINIQKTMVNRNEGNEHAHREEVERKNYDTVDSNEEEYLDTKKIGNGYANGGVVQNGIVAVENTAKMSAENEYLNGGEEETRIEYEALDSDDEEEDDEENVTAPVVFQCGTCRIIIGDSFGFVCSNIDTFTISLNHVANITKSSEIFTSEVGLDVGSSYHHIICAQCQTPLGRMYMTTPRNFDAMRGMYSFDSNMISGYQFGTNREILKAKSANEYDAFAKEPDMIARLQRDMAKVQNLLLVIDERLQDTEARLESTAGRKETKKDSDIAPRSIYSTPKKQKGVII